MKKYATLLFSFFCLTADSAQEIHWYNPIDVSTEEFGNKSSCLALNSEGKPMVLHGSSGDNAGLFLTIMEGGSFGNPIPVTSDTNIFLSDAEGPTMAVSGDKIVVGYQISGEWSLGGRVVVSNDGGYSWSDPITLNNDPTVDFFMPCVGFNPEDNPFVGIKWGANPTLEGIMTYNAFLYGFNEPIDGGAGMAGDAVCECCPSNPFSYNGVYYNLIRNNNNNIRDIWLAVSNDGVTWDEAVDVDPTNWLTNTCPATGASHAFTSGGNLVITYMSSPDGSSRVYYSEVNLNTLELIDTGMLDPDASFTENNPSVSADGEFVASAWERNEGGYDIIVKADLTENLGGGVIVNATESLDINGHLRYPSIELDGPLIHLIFKSQTEGVVKYMRGDIIHFSVEESSGDILNIATTKDNWIISGGVGDYEFSLVDLNGRIMETGTFTNSLEIEKLRGVHILNIHSASYNQSFKLSN